MTQLEAFRRLTGEGHQRRRRRPAIPKREQWLGVLVLLHLVWLVMYAGGVFLEAEYISAAMATFLFLLLFLPSPEAWMSPRENEPSANLRRLLRFPGFWLGLGLLVYIWIQSWNLIYALEVRSGKSQLVLQDYISWLPIGVQTPIEELNPFRGMLMIYVPWMTGCVIWSGFRSRRMVTFLLHSLGVFFTLWAGLALYQLFTKADRIIWIWKTHPSKVNVDIPFFGTLVNENHAAMLLLLGNALVLGLFLLGLHRATKRLRLGGGYLLYLGCGILITFSILMTQARGGIALVAILWFFFLLFCSIFFFRNFRWKGALFPGMFTLIIIGVGGVFLGNPDIWERLQRDWERSVETTVDPQIEGRYYMFEFSKRMISERPWLGWGMGSFKYVHLKYLPEYPEFSEKFVRYQRVENPQPGERRWKKIRLWFDHAHMDIIQWTVEWGFLGWSFALGFFLWMLVHIFRKRAAWDMGMLTMLSGVGLVFLAGFWEFHLHIPSVFLSFWVILILLLKRSALLSSSTGS